MGTLSTISGGPRVWVSSCGASALWTSLFTRSVPTISTAVAATPAMMKGTADASPAGQPFRWSSCIRLQVAHVWVVCSLENFCDISLRIWLGILALKNGGKF